jgi:predicted dehydrogenase
MLKIGVLGAGHLGSIHLKLIKEIPTFELVGFYDPNPETQKKVAKLFGIKSFDTQEELIEAVDIVDIVTPTLSHYDCAVKALKNQKHLFIEKPITNTLEEARNLMHLAHEANVKIQVGHVERFNPAYIAAKPYFTQPMFIECHRLAEFNPRGTDVSVVLDLMIHDIDIILSIVNSPVKKISASGVAVVSDSPDITNARIEFDNGCVANLTASRISLKNMRKTRFFQKDAYITVDFLEKKTSIFQLNELKGEPDPMSLIIDLGKDKGKKEITFSSPDVKDSNAIKDELINFAISIINNQDPIVTIEDGYEALFVAQQIIDKLKNSASLIG